MLYLGATVNADGKFGTELSRRIGMATAEFKQLRALWKNSSVTAARKLTVFDAVVTSKLLYAVASAWLTKGDRRRLDGFHVRCLRQILKIPPSFVSRVSNAKVLQIA